MSEARICKSGVPMCPPAVSLGESAVATCASGVVFGVSFTREAVGKLLSSVGSLAQKLPPKRPTERGCVEDQPLRLVEDDTAALRYFLRKAPNSLWVRRGGKLSRLAYESGAIRSEGQA